MNLHLHDKIDQPIPACESEILENANTKSTVPLPIIAEKMIKNSPPISPR